MNDQVKNLLYSIPGVGAIIVALVAAVTVFQQNGEKGKSPPAAELRKLDSAVELPSGKPATEKTPADRYAELPAYLQTLIDAGVVTATSRPATAKTKDESEAKPLSTKIDKQGVYNLDAISLETDNELEFTTVCIADPKETGVPFRFDQAVSGLTMAMADDQRFSIIADWYPWEMLGGKKPVDATRDPGVMVFQGGRNKTSGKIERRVLFVVGEKLTSGPHPTALTNSLNLIEKIESGSQNRKAFHILGSASTGGQRPLLQTISDWIESRGGYRDNLKEKIKFEIISGSANGTRRFHDLSETVELERLSKLQPLSHYFPTTLFKSNDFIWQNNGLQCLGLHNYVDIRTTQVPTELMKTAAKEFIFNPTSVSPRLFEGMHRKKDRSKIAYLVEMNSGFGNHSTNTWDLNHNLKNDNEPKEGKDPWLFRFPIQIAKLAKILNKERREQEAKVGLKPSGVETLNKAEQNRTQSDEIPTADPDHIAELNRRLLDDIWYEIKRERIGHVILVTSNPHDAIFLVEQLRINCPNVQPVIMGSELFYGHFAYRQAMRGVLLVTSYSLNPNLRELSRQSEEDKRRKQFSSNSTEGVYNALIALNGKRAGEDALAMKDPPDPKSQWERLHSLGLQLAEYRLPYLSEKGSVHKPPIWVTAVGDNGAFVPLKMYADYEDSGVVFDPTNDWIPIPACVKVKFKVPTRPKYDPPVLAGVGPLLAVLLGLTALILIYYFFSFWKLKKEGSKCSTCEIPYDGHLLHLSIAWLIALIGLTVVLFPISAYLIAAGICTDSIKDVVFGSLEYVKDDARWLFPTVGIVAIVIVLILTLLFTVVVFRRMESFRGIFIPAWWKANWSTFAAFLFLLLVGLGILISFVWFWCSGQLNDRVECILFLERTADPFSGHSLVPPCFALGIGLMVYGFIKLHLAVLAIKGEGQIPALADSGPKSTFGQMTSELVTKYNRVIAYSNDPFGSWSRFRRNLGRFSVLLPPVLGVVLYLCCILRASPIFELPVWKCFFYLLFAVAGCLICVSWCKLYDQWRQISQVLSLAARLPFAEAFARMPEKWFQISSRIMLFGRTKDKDADFFSNLWQRIIGSKAADTPAECVNLPRENRAIDSGNPLGGYAYARLAAILPILANHWEKHPASPGDETDKNGKWFDFAEQYVAYAFAFLFAPFFTRLKLRGAMLAAITAALVVAATNYSFQPEQHIMAVITLLAVAILVSLIWLLLRINANAFVSRVHKTTADKVTLDRSLILNAVPVILPFAIITTMQLTGRMRSVLEPLLGYLK